MLDYTQYTANDFALDSSFRKWVLKKEATATLFWDNWLVQHPEKKETIALAQQIVLSLRNAQEEISEEEIEVAIAQLVNAAEQRNIKIIPFFHRLSVRMGMAASLFLIPFLAWIFFVKTNQEPSTVYTESVAQLAQETRINEVVTTAKQTQLVTLPDGSSVMLQPNSRLSYPNQFTSEKREVVLSGEAFFEVAKNANQPFFVYANEMVAKVLGTSFTIKAFAKDKDVQVIVKTGKVAVFSQKDGHFTEKTTQKALSGLVILPNQQLIYKRPEGAFTKTIVAEATLSQLPAIQTQSFVFKHASLEEVFNTLERSYPIRIVYDPALMASCELNATLGDEPLMEKIALICKVIEASYEVKEEQITIHGKGCN